MSSFPDEWKRSKVIPIPKSNNEFRPIPILPFPSKVIISYLIDNRVLRKLGAALLL